MAVSEAQKKASKKYFDNNYKQVKLSMPIKEAEALDAYCQKEGYTRAGFIREAVKEKMERDGNLKNSNINSNSLRNLINSRNTEKEKIE